VCHAASKHGCCVAVEVGDYTSRSDALALGADRKDATMLGLRNPFD
jgi:hypothetical protein